MKACTAPAASPTRRWRSRRAAFSCACNSTQALDLAQAAHEWNCGRQLLAIRLHETQGDKVRESDLFDRSHLLERPLLQAISSEQPCVLLIDEIDRTDAACTTGSTTRRGRANSPSCAPHGLAPKVS